MAMPIENRTQLRILQTLVDAPAGLNITRLEQKMHTSHDVINKNIEALKQKGFVKENRYGRVRIIQLNKENPKTQLIIKLFQEETK